MLHPGQIIDRYTVEAHLGSGGMAEVYRVRHRATDGLHALKVLKSGNPKVRERALQEARVQAALRHPNTVAVTDVIDVDGAPGLVMELVEGGSLLEWLEQDHPDMATRLAVFRAVLRGVQRAHQLDVVHRDLSPHNVLIQQLSDGPHPKVTDFGIAKMLDPERAPAGKTVAGRPMGTPSFMAPEQVRDASDVDQRADIWALGALLYLLVSNRLAFEGRDILEIFNKIADGSYPEPPAGLPPGVVAAIRGCLTVDREARLQSCEAVATVLGSEVPAAVEHAAPPARRSMALPVAAALVVAGLVGAGLWLGTRSTDAGEDAAPVEVVEVVEAVEAEEEPQAEAVEAPPAAAPKVAPVTTKPGPAVVPAAVTEEKAETPPPAADTGTLTVGGDAPGAWLKATSGGKRYEPGTVPAGTYKVMIGDTSVFTAQVQTGGTVHVDCVDKGGYFQCQ